MGDFINGGTECVDVWKVVVKQDVRDYRSGIWIGGGIGILMNLSAGVEVTVL